MYFRYTFIIAFYTFMGPCKVSVMCMLSVSYFLPPTPNLFDSRIMEVSTYIYLNLIALEDGASYLTLQSYAVVFEVRFEDMEAC